MLYLIGSGDYDEYGINEVVDGNGDLIALEKEFAEARSVANPFGELSLYQIYDDIGLLTDDDRYISPGTAFARWLVANKGFRAVSYVEHKVD